MRTWLAMTMLLLVVACGSNGDDDDDSAFCGDGTCLGNETCSTCESDCGQCPASCGDGTCAANEDCGNCASDCGACGCSPGDGTCTGETICIGASCVNAFGRTYTVWMGDVTIKTTTPAGDSWDALGGAPDPYALLMLNGSIVLATSEPQDTFDPVFTDSANVVIPAGASFQVELWDGDVSDDDFIIGCIADPLTADFLRGGGLRCEGDVANGTDGTVVNVLISP